MRHLFFVFVLLSSVIYSQQLGNLFEAEYSYSPNDSDFDYHKTNIKVNYPKKVGKGILLNSLQFAHNYLSYNKNYNINTNELTDFYEIGYTIIYSYPLPKKWRLSGRINPQIVSNLKGSLTSDDVLLNGSFVTTKTWGNQTKGAAFSFGVLYAPISGKQSFFPYINYSAILSPKLSYSIGFPNTFIRYNLSKKDSFSFGLKVYGLNANLSNSNTLEINDRTVQKVQFANFNGNLRYSRFITNIWKIDLNAGYSFTNQYLLADADQEEVFDFDIKNRPFFSVGIAYDLQQALKKKANK